jgi:hypothetical protein
MFESPRIEVRLDQLRRWKPKIIIDIRDSIEAENGILPESWPLIREDRDRE